MNPRSPHQSVSWRPLRQLDLPELAELAGQCLSADGGQPYAASDEFLSRSYLSTAESWGAWTGTGTRLVCATSLRRTGARAPVTTGLVHPAWRRRGIGSEAFDWVAARAGSAPLRAESEALGDGAHALYLSRGLTQVFAEDVMRVSTAQAVPAPRAPKALTLTRWGPGEEERFYAVYVEAFGERPGFPGWPRARWVEWISQDDDFSPEWALLASLDGADVGFIVADPAGWIVQVGVAPSARGQGIGARLVAEVLGRLHAAGQPAATLNVNVNNPHATALYARLGFTRVGRRARYER